MASVPIPNMPEIDNLVMVAKEITGCYGEILVAMATSIWPIGVKGCWLQCGINTYSEYAKNW